MTTIVVAALAFLALIVWWSLRFARRVLDESNENTLSPRIAMRIETIKKMEKERLKMIENGRGDNANVWARNIRVLQNEIRELKEKQGHDAS